MDGSLGRVFIQDKRGFVKGFWKSRAVSLASCRVLGRMDGEVDHNFGRVLQKKFPKTKTPLLMLQTLVGLLPSA